MTCENYAPDIQAQGDCRNCSHTYTAHHEDFRMTEHVKSTSDARTINNSTKQHYRVLTDAEKAQVDIVKQRGAEFIAFLHKIGGTDPEAARMASRDLSLAMTHMEDAVMRAVRHIKK